VSRRAQQWLVAAGCDPQHGECSDCERIAWHLWFKLQATDSVTNRKRTYVGVRRPRFTIHGLWKNFDSGRWPQFCHHERFDASALAPLRPQLDATWPSYYGPNEKFWVRSVSVCLQTSPSMLARLSAMLLNQTPPPGLCCNVSELSCACVPVHPLPC
jgi:Ribonuclease T2 family